VPVLLHILGAAGPWVGVFAAIVIGAFVVFVGMTLSVALFHKNQNRAEHAREILKDLLGLFSKASR